MSTTIKGIRWKTSTTGPVGKTSEFEIDEIVLDKEEAEGWAMRLADGMSNMAEALAALVVSRVSPAPRWEDEEDDEDSVHVTPSARTPVDKRLVPSSGQLTARELEAWTVFKRGMKEWVRNFGVEGEQPNRVEIMENFSHHALYILQMAYARESLQGLVKDALSEEGIDKTKDEIDAISGNLIQVCHTSFPDLAGTYDYLSWHEREPTDSW